MENKIEKILQYRGNEKYFTALCQDKENKLYILLSHINSMKIETEHNEYEITGYKNVILDKIYFQKAQINIQIKDYNNRFYTLMPIKDISEYELINKVLDIMF